ncbi:SDR family NAD(P)-dependent oxidoreductase [Aeromicrobium sp. SMF47]|uniref:NAD-dependent epimerase/dehydratase family protein n=1 Tax=Aeromicrobium TaxID=2040 RepID=UPI00129D64AD|nr:MULTISPECIES: NAD-dependent epimerase/dehydratase family protein [Aeromicrobium]MRJ78300.1 SDR family NAD(P)-dependent oxidoreductase [Aeromicrobium yanjiei]MRK03070.1 SDR family NAD(P)-dependent oxidoreductase [Aeromicrobium sp. S22]
MAGDNLPDVLLVGCGDLGADIGLRLAARGHDVVAIRRRAELVPPPLHGVAADLTREVPHLPPLALDLLVVTLTARPRTEEAYRATYVDGMGRALDAIDAAGQVPRRAVLISSTGVYGDATSAEPLDETTTPLPSDGPAEMLLEAERLFARRVPGGTVLRLSGLYGHGEPRLLQQVRAGEVTDPNRWTNRIHRDDAAAAAVHLLTLDETPGPLYLGTDDEPALLGDVAAHLARGLDVPAPPVTDPAQAHGRRLSNARLRATGWVPTCPTYREGYGS